MSFRDRHRFLNGIYNSYSDPTAITAKDMGDVAQKVGLLMEEVLAWFKDEKMRRAELLANNQPQAQASICQFPTSPESTRASGEASSASSPYNSASPRTPSRPLNNLLPCLNSSEGEKALTPPKSKRGRPAKTHVKSEPDSLSPNTKKLKVSMKYPCPDCGNFLPSERYAEHINRKHFPENVWECPRINQQTGEPCSSSPHYRPSYRPDNFVTHLKGEHDCSDSEIIELKKSCRFEVFDFFHKVCGFCDEALGSRSKSIEHIKEHFRKAFQGQNPPIDLGASMWKEKCGSGHKLQRGLHYGRSQASKSELKDKSHEHEHDGHQGGDGGSGEGNSKHSGHNNTDFQSSNNTHDHDNNEGRHFGHSYSNNQSHDNSDSQTSNINHDDYHDHKKDKKSSKDLSDSSSYLKNVDGTFYQYQPSMWSSRRMEDGCSKCSETETSNTVSMTQTKNHILQHHIHKNNEEDFHTVLGPQNTKPQHYPFSDPRSFDHDAHLYPVPKDVCPTKSVVPYTEKSPYNMESLDLRPPSYYSPSSGSSTSSSVMSSPFSGQGSIPPKSDWCLNGLGLHPSIVSCERFYGQEYSFGSAYMEEFPDELNPMKPGRFIDCSPQSFYEQSKFSSEERKVKDLCTYPECGKVFKDLKAHMLSHMNERPEKCPIQTCEYSIKGFARKYDKNRHTLTHYKGTMVCGFCPGSGSAAEKSFNRADVFKRHLTSAHGVEQTPPNSRKKMPKGNVNSSRVLSGYAPDATGKCSTCSATFNNAQEFYDHLDDCVLRIVQQEEPSEAINAARLAKAENDLKIQKTLCNDAVLTIAETHSTDEDEDDQLTDDDYNYTSLRKKHQNDIQKRLGHTQKKGCISLARKNKKYPTSWGCDTPKMKMKKASVFDRPRRLYKHDMMLDTDHEVCVKLNSEKVCISDLDLQTLRRAEDFYNSSSTENAPWIVDDLTCCDSENLVEVERRQILG